MRKKVIFLLIMFLVPFSVKANSVSLSCDEVIKSDSLSCTIKGNSSSLVTAVSIKVRNGDNLSFSSFEGDSIWQGDGEEGEIDLYTANDIINDFTIGTVNFKVNTLKEGTNNSVTLDSIFFYDDQGKEVVVNPVTKNFRVASSNNNLSSLSLSAGSLNPGFNKDITSYSATIDTESININAKAENNYATISGNVGKVNLKYGNNKFSVVVKSEMGTSKTYTINIIRPNNNVSNNQNNNDNNNDIIDNTKSSNNNLKSLKLNHGNINFNKEVLEYSTNVSYEVANIEVEAISEDSKAKVEVSGNKDLVVGNNKIQIKVIAEDKTEKVYIINVVRNKEDYVLSSNNNITNINILGYEFNFDPNIYEYTLDLIDDKNLNIEVLLENDKATYKILGNNNLVDGSNIEIISMAEDGSTKSYKIIVKFNNSNVINDNQDKIIRASFIIVIIVLLVINLIRLIFKYRRVKNEG